MWVGLRLDLYRFAIIILLGFALCGGAAIGQNSLSGVVRNAETNAPIVGARVLIKGTTFGALTNEEGAFRLNVNQTLPITLNITYIGYDTLDEVINTYTSPLSLTLQPGSYELGEVEITASAYAERQKQSPLSVESLSINAIKETPAANFYEGLGHLKGVDVTAASLGFKVINTRGFNSTAPVRSLQTIDGVDNQSPGLNFSLGNFLGASELDVESVDLIVGASSAY